MRLNTLIKNFSRAIRYPIIVNNLDISFIVL